MIWGFVGWQAVIIVSVLIISITIVLSSALFVVKAALQNKAAAKSQEQHFTIRKGDNNQ